MVKISIFTTGTNPVSRGDLFDEPLTCYHQLADEVVYVDGSGDLPNGQHNDLYYAWPKEFDWPFIGQQFQRGYEACTGDWVIHADLDFIFHENDFEAIRKAFEDNPDAPALSFWKYQFILPDRYNLKSRLVVAVNKGKFGDRIRFDSGGDLCQPSLDGKELKPDDVPESRIAIYNYEKMLKTKKQIMDDTGRMARAWQRHFGDYKLGGPDDESAYNEWYKMASGRFTKPQEFIPLDKHPKYIRLSIDSLKPEMWGFSGFGLIDGKVYA